MVDDDEIVKAANEEITRMTEAGWKFIEENPMPTRGRLWYMLMHPILQDIAIELYRSKLDQIVIDRPVFAKQMGIEESFLVQLMDVMMVDGRYDGR